MSERILDNLSSISTTTTSSSLVVVPGGSTAVTFLADMTVGSGSQWTISLQYAGPTGNTIEVATSVITSSGVSVIDVGSSFQPDFSGQTNLLAVPNPNTIVYTLSTSGTTDTLSGYVIAVTPD